MFRLGKIVCALLLTVVIVRWQIAYEQYVDPLAYIVHGAAPTKVAVGLMAIAVASNWFGWLPRLRSDIVVPILGFGGAFVEWADIEWGLASSEGPVILSVIMPTYACVPFLIAITLLMQALLKTRRQT